MKNLLIIALFLCPLSSFGQNFSYSNWCQLGGQGVVTQSLKSKGTYTLPSGSLIANTGVQASYPGCQVNVYDTGTLNHSTIFSNVGGGALGNPFTANSDASFLFFAAAACYDVVTSGGSMPSPHTDTDVCLGGSGTPGSGTVTIFSAGTLSPLFTTSVLNATSAPALSFALSNAAAHAVFGRNAGTTGAPSYFLLTTGELPFTYTGNTLVLPTVSASFSGSGAPVCRDGSGNLTTSGCTGSGVTSFNARTGAVTPQTGDYGVANITGAAPTASPAFSGVPTAPTAAPGTNTVQLATTAFVIANGAVSSFNGRTGAVTPQAGDYLVNQITGAAPLASPGLTGVPTTPTAAPGTNTTQIASTAFVLANLPSGGGVVLAPSGDQTLLNGFSLLNDGGCFGAVNTAATPSTSELDLCVNGSGRGELSFSGSASSVIFFDVDGGIVFNPVAASINKITYNNAGVLYSGSSASFSTGASCAAAPHGTCSAVYQQPLLFAGNTSGGTIVYAQDIAGSTAIGLPAANGTASLFVMQDCGTGTACTGTVKTNPIIVRGEVVFPSATTVSLSALPFTGATTYSCTGSDLTTAAGVISFTTYTSGTAVTLTETGGTNVDHARYICVGF